MKINFLAEECSKKVKEPIFGVCDGPASVPAFVTTKTQDKWVAIVHNPSKTEVTFHAVDDCVEILRESGEEESRCDALLTYPNNIVFIELKEVRSNWIVDGTAQLKVAVETFAKNHDLGAIRKRRAFLANRRHPSFKFGLKEQMEKFKVETSVHLLIHNEIKV
jgi:hypothetical protein